MSSQRKIHPISQAVRELRTALGESQQEFAYRLETAIRTISRWETIQPPHGGTLAEMARLAGKAKRPDIAAKFQRAITAELPFDPFLGDLGKADFKRGSDGSEWGFIHQWLEGKEERECGRWFFEAINRLRPVTEADTPERREALRQAFQDFTERVKAILEYTK